MGLGAGSNYKGQLGDGTHTSRNWGLSKAQSARLMCFPCSKCCKTPFKWVLHHSNVEPTLRFFSHSINFFFGNLTIFDECDNMVIGFYWILDFWFFLDFDLNFGIVTTFQSFEFFLTL